MGGCFAAFGGEARLKPENESLRSRVKELEDAEAPLKRENETLRSRVQELEGGEAPLKRENETLRSRVQELQGGKAPLKHENETLRSKVQELESQLSEQERELEDMLAPMRPSQEGELESQQPSSNRLISGERGPDKAGHSKNWISNVHWSHSKPRKSNASMSKAEEALVFASAANTGDPELLRRALLNAIKLGTHTTDELALFKERLAKMLLVKGMSSWDNLPGGLEEEKLQSLLGSTSSLEQLRTLVVDAEEAMSAKAALGHLLMTRDLKSVSDARKLGNTH